MRFPNNCFNFHFVLYEKKKFSRFPDFPLICIMMVARVFEICSYYLNGISHSFTVSIFMVFIIIITFKSPIRYKCNRSEPSNECKTCRNVLQIIRANKSPVHSDFACCLSLLNIQWNYYTSRIFRQDSDPFILSIRKSFVESCLGMGKKRNSCKMVCRSSSAVSITIFFPRISSQRFRCGFLSN